MAYPCKLAKWNHGIGMDSKIMDKDNNINLRKRLSKKKKI